VNGIRSHFAPLNISVLSLLHGITHAQRDIVQFVPFRKFRGMAPTALSKETLAELPGQVLQFCKMYDIKPMPPRAARAVSFAPLGASAAAGDHEAALLADKTAQLHVDQAYGRSHQVQSGAEYKDASTASPAYGGFAAGAGAVSYGGAPPGSAYTGPVATGYYQPAALGHAGLQYAPAPAGISAGGYGYPPPQQPYLYQPAYVQPHTQAAAVPTAPPPAGSGVPSDWVLEMLASGRPPAYKAR